MSVVQKVVLILSVTLAAISAILHSALFSQLRPWSCWRWLSRGGGCLSFSSLRQGRHTPLIAVTTGNSFPNSPIGQMADKYFHSL